MRIPSASGRTLKAGWLTNNRSGAGLFGVATVRGGRWSCNEADPLGLMDRADGRAGVVIAHRGRITAPSVPKTGLG